MKCIGNLNDVGTRPVRIGRGPGDLGGGRPCALGRHWRGAAARRPVERAPEVVAEESVQQRVNAAAGIGEHVRGDLHSHSRARDLVHAEALQNENYLEQGEDLLLVGEGNKTHILKINKIS